MNLSHLLRSCPIFESLTASDLDVLDKAMMVQRYPNGHEFMRENERGGTMYVIVEGTVLVTQKNMEAEGFDVVHVMNAGDVFGLIALIDHGKRSAACTAAGEVTAASLPSSAFQLLYHANAPIAQHFQYCIARQLAHDVRNLSELLVNALHSTSPEREALLQGASYEYR
ncbi:MAG: cyclic nucleotide-binding domain-containing protein [Burkholderiales bacterium]|nr:cyclic nucleotide-binding domain-containing protein [Burkholderiales bacterium]